MTINVQITETQLLQQTIWRSSKDKNETNDCSVKALAVTTGLPYDDCHKALEAEGRKNRKGVTMPQIRAACERLGFAMIRAERNEYSAKTMITAERDRRVAAMGRVLVNTSGHVAGMVDGTVVDWSKGRRNRIISLYRVRPIPGHQPRTMEPVPFIQFRAIPEQLSLI